MSWYYCKKTKRLGTTVKTGPDEILFCVLTPEDKEGMNRYWNSDEIPQNFEPVLNMVISLQGAKVLTEVDIVEET